MTEEDDPKPAKRKVRDFRITQFDPTLGSQFPAFADWAVVGVSRQYPYPRAGDEVLTIKHWTQKTYVHIRPPKAAKPGVPT